ncbi:homocysteine S-methyltransferase family protein [Pseudomonas sp. JS3066]|uniref:homocysteine S-methyltransferase family protein n=1 Tax=unclassified Pseudomonas TaxID=196821 RepID=UPI000EAAA03C|nr:MULTISPECIES: homocysteine S-methyltransferase family protein [unclassified Pseudomonas]AYF86975.1 homocysteine S-methyltransferase [Pseudomonas sp. DY-1]MDH4651776.1 homocysteine S-methyltransferase family protein [Pseudomonas sp. BN606]MRK23965.1 homocysteine S-methyltransferase family protein [Pseudomonas sp. JG-B]WVK95531.1 homocysteine S-methyltransferase family protein [Pseudomonas sp. JS3066]
MAQYRDALPQLEGELFLTDGGIETTLVFHEGLALPDFAAFVLLNYPDGQEALRKYFRTYCAIASHYGTGLILESPTWRANPDWASHLGFTPQGLAEANRQAIALLDELRREVESGRTPVVVSGCVGPRGDGYIADETMDEYEAQQYHSEQIGVFAETSADMITAMTMNYVEEALGIALAARAAQMPVAIAFTVETDGRLPTGQDLKEALEQVDRATASYPAYYMINCAHPDHFEDVLVPGSRWVQRIRGLRANASRKSHAELNEAIALDSGDPEELGAQYAWLRQRLPHINVMGGCCGTDHRHIEQMAKACKPLFRAAL